MIQKANCTNKNCFFEMFLGVRVFYSLTLRLFENDQRVKDISVPLNVFYSFRKNNEFSYRVMKKSGFSKSQRV